MSEHGRPTYVVEGSVKDFDRRIDAIWSDLGSRWRDLARIEKVMVSRLWRVGGVVTQRIANPRQTSIPAKTLGQISYLDIAKTRRERGNWRFLCGKLFFAHRRPAQE